MTLIVADRFESGSLQGWWYELNPGQLNVPISFGTDAVGTYAQLELAVGSTGGSFHFNANDGYGLFQRVKGDFDAAWLIRAYNLALSDVPPAGSARLVGPAIHSPVRPEAAPQYVTTERNYYHLVNGRAPGGVEGDSQPVIEWKTTTSNASTWNTVPHPSPSDCLCWMRLRRVGTSITSYVAGYEGSPLTIPSSWTTVETRTIAQVPELADVGPVIYSSNTTANIAGRIYAAIPLINAAA